jgi:hypothetical protein
MSESNGTGRGGTPPRRRGRQALFSADAGPDGGEPVESTEPIEASGRRALFSSTEPGPATGRAASAAGRGTAVVHCRTCLAATPVSLATLGRALIPSLWWPMRPWPRLMRCPACHRTSWCRIDWPSLR